MTGLLAIAIEDDVDLVYENGGYRRLVRSRRIAEKHNYLDSIKSAIKEMLEELLEEIPAQQLGSDRGDFFNSIGAVVVSLPGVIGANQTLLQVPLWHSTGAPTVKDGFDVGAELTEIAKQLIGAPWRVSEAARFRDAVFVVNDTTACAAFECSQRTPGTGRADFRYVKIHNGVNVGIVGESAGRIEVPTTHAEAGHGLSIRHQLDFATEFEGVCPYHYSCFEGLLAVHSLCARANVDSEKAPVFQQWKQHLRLLEGEGIEGQQLDNAMARYVLGANGVGPSGQGEGVDIVGHYVAQLVLQLLLNPPVPGQIVLGGRLAVPAVVEKVCLNILEWSNGYPWRPELQRDRIGSYVVRSIAGDSKSMLIEVSGALALARSRAGIAYDKCVVDRSVDDAVEESTRGA